MKSKFHKISAITLSLLVLLSTFSFTVDKHYCGDFLVDVSFTGDAHDCGMEMDATSTKKKNCCKDEVVKIEGQDELKLSSFEEISFQNQQFLVTLHVYYQSLFDENLEANFMFREFPPPEIETDFQITNQTFLI